MTQTSYHTYNRVSKGRKNKSKKQISDKTHCYCNLCWHIVRKDDLAFHLVLSHPQAIAFINSLYNYDESMVNYGS